jgi:dCMP deaminase
MERREKYLSWDDTFMMLAHLISQRSKDPSTQIGAVIVDKHNVILGLGYNGWPRGIKQDDLPWGREGKELETKYPYVVHGEINAIFNAYQRVNNARLYCNLFPCNECAKAIIQNGIKEVIYESDKYHEADNTKAARRLLDLAGVKYRQYTTESKMSLELK